MLGVPALDPLKGALLFFSFCSSDSGLIAAHPKFRRACRGGPRLGRHANTLTHTVKTTLKLPTARCLSATPLRARLHLSVSMYPKSRGSWPVG